MMNVLNDPSFIHQVTKLKEELDSYAEMEGGIIQILDDDIEEMMALSEPQSKGEGETKGEEEKVEKAEQ